MFVDEDGVFHDGLDSFLERHWILDEPHRVKENREV